MDTSNLDTLLTELTKLEAAATKGPWHLEQSPMWDPEYYDEKDGDERYSEVGPIKSCDGCAIAHGTDVKFVAESRNSLPTLIAVINEMKGALEIYADATRYSEWDITPEDARTALSRCEEIVKGMDIEK